MTTKKSIELNPQQAGDRIGVSPRTILNFINQKRFEAVKVGREWFIDEASFISFCQRYGYAYEKQSFSAVLADPVISSKDLSAVSPTAVEICQSKAASQKLSQLSDGSTPSILGAPSQKSGLKGLRSYQLILELVQKNYSVLDEARSKKIEGRRLWDVLLRSLEALGAGYYAFGFEEKSKHYRAARSYLGAALALRPFMIKDTTTFEDFFESIETRVIPSITALLKKIESKYQR